MYLRAFARARNLSETVCAMKAGQLSSAAIEIHEGPHLRQSQPLLRDGAALPSDLSVAATAAGQEGVSSCWRGRRQERKA